MDADPAAPDETSRVLRAAAEVLRQHLPDTDGWCLGCVALWGRLVFHEHCTQAQWARAIYAAYGRQPWNDGDGRPGRRT